MKRVRLEDITINITDGKHGDCDAAEHSGYYFISCKDVRDGSIDYTNARQITEQAFIDAHKRTMLEPNDILVTNSGTIGRMALIKDVPETYRTTFQKSVAIVKPDTSKVVPSYLYYKLQNCVHDFINQSNGSAQKNLLLGTMRNFPIDIHESFQEQEKMASILSNYDELIENNQKQIILLEEAAQRLYKEWFIDLRFPGHETIPFHDGIPKGWKKTNLDELVEFNPKYIISKDVEKRVFPMAALSTASMILDFDESTLTKATSGTKFSNGDTLVARITPCLENGKTAFVSGLKNGEIAIGSTEFIVMRSKLLNPYMVYLLARSTDFRETAINSMTGSDGRQRAQLDKLKQYPFLLPPQQIIDLFQTLIAPLFKKTHLLNEENARLKESRNRLLPKLMDAERGDHTYERN